MKLKSELEDCPLCQRERVGAQSLLTTQGKSFVRCSHCGLIYQDPPPLAEESREYYEKNYYENFGDRNPAIQQARFSLYRKVLHRCAPYRRMGRLLDIGSGYGDFLKMAQEEGWEAWGIEPSRQASEFARDALGLKVLNQPIEAVDFPPEHFDVVTLLDVIDCIPDPAGTLRRIEKWLSPGGQLVIRTPNAFFHWKAHRLYSKFGFWLKKLGWEKDPAALKRTNYTAHLLRRVLQEAGFSGIRIENGVLSAGDPYQVFSRSVLMRIGKSLVYFGARLVEFFSARRILIGSNFLGWASKGRPYSKFRPLTLQVRILLKSAALHLLAIFGYLLGLPIWLRMLGKDREIRIVNYHSVNESRKHEVNVRESQFENQIDFLSRHYSVISLEEAIEYLEKGENPPRAAVAVTFDDGYEDNYQIACPILKKHGLSATIFLLSGGEGPERRLVHLWDQQPHYNRLLRWEQAREMAASGITFGSHGASHARLSDLSPEKMRSEIFASKEKIESEIGRPVRFLSYPYGSREDFNRRTEFLAREAGYRAAFSAIFGTNTFSTNRFALRRIGIEASDTLFTFRAKLNGALSLLFLFDLPPFRKMIRWTNRIFLEMPPPRPQKKQTLLLVSVDFPPHTDGVSTISRELSARIANRGGEVMVIGPSDEGDREFDATQPYDVIRLPGYEWGTLRFLPFLVTLPIVILRHGIRKVFAMNIAYGGVLSWILSFVVPLEYMIFAYGYEFEKVKKSPFLRQLYLGIYRRAKKIVTCSELVKQRLIGFGVSEEKIKVLYPAVDLDRFHPARVPAEYLDKKKLTGRKILLTVGRLVERKGHDRVLEALPKIISSFPEVLYCIVGIGPHEKTLRDQVRRLNLEPHVRFMGKVPGEELALLYNACEVFVMPSREISEGGHIEGFGIVFLEANACGKPVIGGKSGGMLEAIRDGKTGFLIDPHSPEAISEKIIFFLSDPEKARKMGDNGMRWVRNNFSWDRYVEEARRYLCGGDSS